MSLNLPNSLAIVRIALAPALFLLLTEANNFSHIHISWINYFAGLIFVIASVTDFFDGYIAREWNQKTTLGAILDPLADKMLTLGAFLGLMILGRANVWAIYLILIREFFITGLRVAIASSGGNISAGLLGKIKTIVQMIAIGWLIMQWQYANAILWIAVVLTIISGIQYVNSFLKLSRT